VDELRKELNVESDRFYNQLPQREKECAKLYGESPEDVFCNYVAKDCSPCIEYGEYRYELRSFETATGIPFTSSISESLYNAICDGDI